MQSTQNNRGFLIKQWESILTSKDAKMIMVGNIDGYQYRAQGGHRIILNPSLKNKMSRNPHAEHKQSQKTVFIAFSPKAYNFSNLPNNQMICHINLDEEQLISKEDSYKITEQFFDKGEDSQCEDDKIEAHSHPLFINTSPICKGHSMLLMYPDEQLPQVVGSDILLLLLNIFKIFPGIKVGYNSLGAAASVNHLHFHMLYSQDLIGEQALPIERIKTTNWLKSSLVNPSQEINLYSVGVSINQFNEFGSYGFVITPYMPGQQQLEFAEVTNSLSFVFGIISNQLIELSIPHNVVITNNGQTIYIFMRDFSSKNPNYKYGWLQYSGVIPVFDEKVFESLKEDEIILMKKKLTVENEAIELVKKNVKKHLSNFL